MSFHSAICKTPYESMYGEKPNLKFVNVFGRVAYSFVQKTVSQKTTQKLYKKFFLGTSEKVKQI